MTPKREQIITQLLERYTELADPMQSGNGGGDTGLRLMPRTYTPSVKELERLMVELRETRHHIWWHVNERYLKARQRTAFHCPKCRGVSHAATHKHRNKHGKPTTYNGVRVLQTTWHERVNPKKVDQGITWLAGQWTLAHEPFLPDELRIAA